MSMSFLRLPDVQSTPDLRGVAIDAVGVKGLRHPITVRSGHGDVATVATLSMTVALPASERGAHMSRFVEVLESRRAPLDSREYRAMVTAMVERLGARSGSIEMRFPYFVRKAAPVSRASSLLDHDVMWRGRIDDRGDYRLHIRVAVPATSLCPCSKEISAYGAHNQRSLIAIEAEVAGDVEIEELIGVAEASASCEVYGLLKRADEKHVTEAAYDNPKFVEDLVRDVAMALDKDRRILGYTVEAENFESIHNHSAFARIEKVSRARGGSAP
jgi:GTP cyclohydrolase IB